MWFSGHKRPRSTALYGVLSAIENATQRASSLEEMLTILDASKRPLFDNLLLHFTTEIEAKAVTLKILNLYLARHHFLARSTTVLSRPYGLVVDPSNSCNLACPGCVHSEHSKELKLFDWKPGMLAEKRMTPFFKTYGLNSIHVTFCNYGEPLVNPETPKYIQLAKSYLTRTLLSTNLALPRFDAEAYVESGLDYMVLSIDGATQAIYERFRRKGNLELVFANIRKLVEAKRSLGRQMPLIVWRFLAFKHNIHEIPLAIEKARELGVDEFKADPAWDVSWDDPDIRPADIEPVTVKFGPSLSEAFIANWNPFPHTLDAAAIEREFDRRCADRATSTTAESLQSAQSCEWLYKSITMDSGGRIFPCCCAPRPKADLHFAQFDGGDAPESFNSDKHRRSRLFFADAEGYRADRDARGLQTDPYCVKCEWDKAADPNSAQLRLYFNSLGRERIDTQSVDLLASW